MASAALLVTSVAGLATVALQVAAAGSASTVMDVENVLIPAEMLHSVHEQSPEDQVAEEGRPTMKMSLLV